MAETVSLMSLAGQKLEQNITVEGIDKEAPQIFMNGTNPIDPNAVYHEDINLKFYDNAALDYYELNGHTSPTGLSGTWGDGNYVNIKGYLNLDGENTVTVWDKAGNYRIYTFIMDQTAPDVQVEVEKADEMTPTKTVTLYVEEGEEPFRLVDNDSHSSLWFTPQNDDDHDGYATVWKVSATKPIYEGFTIEDQYGNQRVVAVLVTNVDSLVPEADVQYMVTEPTENDVPVQMTWNTGLSEEFEETLEADGWKKTAVVPPTFVRIFKKNETLTYNNVESQSGVPGKTLVVTVDNIITKKEIGVNYWDVVNNEQAGEGSITVDANATAVDLASLTDIPEGYELATESASASINDGWIYVEVRPEEIEETTKDVEIVFVDEATGEEAGTTTITVEKEDTMFSIGILADFVPEGYELAELGDAFISESGATEIKVRRIEEQEMAEAVLIVNFVGPFGEEIDVEPVTVTKEGTEGTWVTFYYGKDWKIPRGYDFAEDFDETAAKQEIKIKYGEILDSLEIGIVPKKAENKELADVLDEVKEEPEVNIPENAVDAAETEEAERNDIKTDESAADAEESAEDSAEENKNALAPEKEPVEEEVQEEEAEAEEDIQEEEAEAKEDVQEEEAEIEEDVQEEEAEAEEDIQEEEAEIEENIQEEETEIEEDVQEEEQNA